MINVLKNRIQIIQGFLELDKQNLLLKLFVEYKYKSSWYLALNTIIE